MAEKWILGTIIRQKWSIYRVALYSSKSYNKKKITNFMLQQYSNYFDKLEKKFPKATTVYKVFMDGIKLLHQDLKQYMKILSKLNVPGESIHKLSRHELEIYERMPQEIVKLTPVLICSTLPAGYMVFMPLAYLFPKYLVTQHFWTPKQCKQFLTEGMVNRLKHGTSLIKLLTAPNICIQRQVADEKLWKLLQIDMKTKQPILPYKLIGCIDLFKAAPFHVDNISHLHLMHLARLNNIHSYLWIRKKLKRKARMILAMDRAIIKEGGIKKLSVTTMRNVCRLRGLYADDLDAKEMLKWLNDWMRVSVSVDESSLSLLLHAPALLGHSAPANRTLLNVKNSALSKLQMNSRAALKRMTY